MLLCTTCPQPKRRLPASTLTPRPLGNTHHAQGWNQNGSGPQACREQPPGTEGSRCGLLFHLLLASPRPLETEATLLIEVGAALVRSVCAESQGAASVCGKNRKQEGSCHQPWAVGSSTSPQCFCLSEAKDEQSSIYLNSSQLGPENGLLVVRLTSSAWDGHYFPFSVLTLVLA